jgi:hypothetical protein
MKNPRLLQASQTLLATVALTGLMAGAAARVSAATPTGSGGQYSAAKGVLADDNSGSKHSCKGQNGCKGQGGCKSGDNGCKGKNSCKGKGGCATDGSKKS